MVVLHACDVAVAIDDTDVMVLLELSPMSIVNPPMDKVPPTQQYC